MNTCEFINKHIIGQWEILAGESIPTKWQGIVRDNNTGETYYKDSPGLIRFKCAAISIGNVFRTAIVEVFNICGLIADIATIAAKAFWNLGKEFAAACKGETLNHQENGQASILHAFMVLGKNLFIDLFAKAMIDLLRIIKDPLCGIATEILTVYGQFDPYNARKMIGRIEAYGFNEGHLFNHRVSDPFNQERFYLYPCFQGRPYSDFSRDTTPEGNQRPRGLVLLIPA